MHVVAKYELTDSELSTCDQNTRVDVNPKCEQVLRLASMLEALALGRKITVAGDANLMMQMMEFPITSMHCLTLSAWVEEACRPTGLLTEYKHTQHWR